MLYLTILIYAIAYTPSGAWGMVVCVLVSILGFLITDAVAWYANRAMLRERLWQWGKNKFSSWGEMSTWIDENPGSKLEEAAACTDDSWTKD